MAANQNTHLHQGFTLIEIIITLVVSSVIAVGVIQVSGKMAARSANPMILYQAVAIAESYMDEILARDFTPDISSAACDSSTSGLNLTRANYTSICHYSEIDDNGAKDQNGNDISGLASYRVQVDVLEATLGSGSDQIRAADSQRIVVTVDGPDNIQAIISAYRTYL